MQQLLKDLIEVYDNNEHEVGKVYQTRYDTNFTLLPMYHILNKSQIEIHLTIEGELLRTKVKNKMIPMPVTENSLSRGAGNHPHLLHDKLIYLCKDITQYTRQERLKSGEEHKKYIQQLSQFENPIIKAIHMYLTNNSLIKDLIDQKVLFLDEDGLFLEKSNGEAIYKKTTMDSCIENLFVRFHVESDTDKYIWEDEVFMKQVVSEIEEKNLYQPANIQGFCYVEGKNVQIAKSYPYKIRHVGDMARFMTSSESASLSSPYIDMFAVNGFSSKNIGIQSSFKAHNALSWLIEKQGIEINGMVYLLWSNQSKESLTVESGFDFLDDYIPEKDEDLTSLTNETLSKRIFNQALGLTADIETDEDIMFLTLDAYDRTKGTIAILDYQRFEAKNFLEKIQLWSKNAQYYHYFQDDNTKNYRVVYKAPSIFDILEALKVQKNFYKMLYRLLLPTFIEGKAVPSFIVKTLREKLMKYRVSSIYQWNDIARCYFSCIKYNEFLKGNKIENSLDILNKDKDYLAGRLFAYMTYTEDMLANKKFQIYNPALKYHNIFVQNTEKLKNHLYIKNVCKRGIQKGILDEEHLDMIDYLLENINGNCDNQKFYIGYLHQYDFLKGAKEHE